MKNSLVKFTCSASVILLFALIYYACDDSGVTAPTDTQFCISAKLTNWVPGNKSLYAQINSSQSAWFLFANTPVDTQGNFNLCLPPPADTTLYTSDSIFYSGCSGGTVTFDPPDVRGTQIMNFKVYSNGVLTGNVDCVNFTRYDSIKAGDYETRYIYVNKAVTVTGTKICSGDTLMFNGSAQTGWNKIFKHYQRVSQGSRTILYDLNDPGTAIWRYHGD